MKTIQEVLNIIAASDLMYAVNYIDLIDENVPNTNASIVLKFRYNKPRLLEILTEYNKNYGISNNNILMALFNQSACKSEHFNPKRIENEEITEDKVNFLDKICLIREKAYQTIFELSNSLTKSKKVKNEKYVKSFTNILRKYPNLNTEKFVKNLALLWLGKEMYKNTYKTSAMTEMLENIALIS
nr:MAG: hypothetical protein [Bacteriophage sp.]